jgi:acyl-CoA thioester hydrolase
VDIGTRAVGRAKASNVTGGNDWPLQRRFRVPYHDIDAMNHLNHAAYFPMMETLRCAYYLPMLGSTDPTDLDIIVAEATCRYLAPVRYDAELIGEVAPVRPLGTTSFTLVYRFTDATSATVVARGRTVLVTYDYGHATKVPIPDERRARLERDAVDARAEGW